MEPCFPFERLLPPDRYQTRDRLISVSLTDLPVYIDVPIFQGMVGWRDGAG